MSVLSTVKSSAICIEVLYSSFSLSMETCCYWSHLNSAFLWVNVWIVSASNNWFGMNLDVQTKEDLSKAHGPDGITARTLQEAAPAISVSLAKLFNLSIQNGQLPDDRKSAHVTPVYKKGKKGIGQNYRVPSYQNSGKT